MYQNIARFLLSYLVFETIFWFKQDAVLQNRFRFESIFIAGSHYFLRNNNSGHGTIIRTGIAFYHVRIIVKIPCYMRDSACKWLPLLKKLKYFEVMLNIFEFWQV